jgi:hypothetical protein
MMRSICKPLLLVAFLGTVVAVPALAQTSSYPPACDASKVSKGDVDRAHAVFLSGKQFLDESNYDKAISYFNDAYSIDCSVHAILPIIATAYERKGDKTEAVRALEEYLRRVPNAADREHVERRIKNLNDQLAHEPAPASSTSASSATTASAAPTVTAPEPSATPPTTASVAAPEEQPRQASPGPWIFIGLGGALVIGGVVTYVVGSGDISSASSTCPTRMNCPPSVASQGNEGRTLRLVGGIIGGAGLISGAVGVTWLIIHWLDSRFPARPAGTSGYISPVVAPGYAGVVVGSSL